MPSRRRHERDRSEAVPAGRDSLWAQCWNPIDGPHEVSDLAGLRAAIAKPRAVVWIDLVSPDKTLLESLTALLGLHPLITEDILESNQRAKIEVTGEFVHLVMFALRYEGEVVAHELDIVLGKQFLLTSHDEDIDIRNAPFMRRNAGGRIDEGADFALWQVTDWLVDEYFPLFDRLGDEIDELEVDVVRRPGKWVVERLFTLRRDLLQVRHAINPQREIFNQLTNRDLSQISPERIIYFRDVYDHLIRLTDELDSYREMVSTTLDIYLSQINNNLSDVMKRLTSVTVVLAGIGAVGGIFGMSQATPALAGQEGFGFWAITVATIIAAALLIAYLRRIDWV